MKLLFDEMLSPADTVAQALVPAGSRFVSTLAPSVANSPKGLLVIQK